MQIVCNAEQDARTLLDLIRELGRSYPIRDPLAHMCEKESLSPVQFHALMWIGRDGPLNMKETASRLGITEKTVTGLIDRMEQRGYVKRLRLPADRRSVHVELTGKGRKLWKTMDSHIHAQTASFLSALPDEDRESLIRIISRLVDRLLDLKNNQG